MRRILVLVVIVVLTAGACTDRSDLAAAAEGDLAFVDETTVDTASGEPEIQPADDVPDESDVESDIDSNIDSEVDEDIQDAPDELEVDPQGDEAEDVFRPDLTVVLSAVTADGEGDGLVVAAGEAVTWSYQVTNTGDVDLTEVDVVDEVEGLVCTINLAIGQTVDCEATSSASAGEFTKSASATVTVDGTTVSASDHSGYVGLDDSRQALDLELAQITATGAKSFSGVASATNASTGSDPVYLSDFLVAVESNDGLVNVSCTVETMPAGELPEFIVFDDEIPLNFECEASNDLDGEYVIAVKAGIGGSDEIIEAQGSLDA